MVSVGCAREQLWARARPSATGDGNARARREVRPPRLHPPPARGRGRGGAREARGAAGARARQRGADARGAGAAQSRAPPRRAGGSTAHGTNDRGAGGVPWRRALPPARAPTVRAKAPSVTSDLPTWKAGCRGRAVTSGPMCRQTETTLDSCAPSEFQRKTTSEAL